MLVVSIFPNESFMATCRIFRLEGTSAACGGCSLFQVCHLALID